jgi:hypothetical protein
LESADTADCVSATPKSRTAGSSAGRLWVWAGWPLLALAFVAGAALTWRKWPDLIVDFGLQLYIPWRLSQGAVLYRDLYYMAGGPLSQYWHALLFRWCGPSFLVLILSNLCAAAAMLALIGRGFRQAAGPLCGFVTTLAVICVFGFGQYTGVGNSNYAAPYSHEMLHGLLLSLAALSWLSRWLARKTLAAAAAAGCCLGLVTLTKPDICLALIVTTVTAFVLATQSGRGFLLRSAAMLVGGAMAPLAVFL